MKKNLILLSVILGIFQTGNIEAQEAFVPSGSPLAKIYSNFHSNFDGTSSAFEITRAYFGYQYHMNAYFTGKVLLDVGTPHFQINDTTQVTSSLNLTAYLKEAQLTYKKGNLEMNMGMIGLRQFKIQETYWGHRYIEKSFQDLFGFGPSADLGADVSYRFGDLFSADLTFRNGEGYKKLQSDNKYNTGLGWTLTPVKGLVIRGYYDRLKKDVTQYTEAYFAGYQNKKLTAGVEYNIQDNYRNKDNHNLFGYSVYGSYNLTDRFQVFARYDKLNSNTLNSELQKWDIANNGDLLIGGVQFTPVKGVKIALDYQGWMPELSTMDNQNAVYLNFEYAF